MDNTNPPPEDGPSDRTAPYSFDPGSWPQAPGGAPGERPKAPARRRYGSVTRWMAGLGLAALLVGGGSVLGARLAGGSGGTKSAAAAAMLAGNTSSTANGQSGLDSVLGGSASAGALSATMLADGQASGALAKGRGGLRRCVAQARHLRATGHRAAALAKLRSCLRRALRLRLLGGLYGQVTFKTKAGIRTFAFERGVIQTVSGSSVVVKAADGTTLTWDLVTKTVIVRARHLVGTAALTSGERVFVVGPVVSGADDARLIIIRR